MNKKSFLIGIGVGVVITYAFSFIMKFGYYGG